MFRTFALLVIVGLCYLTDDCLAAERNVILFVTDDMGSDAGCYGNAVIKTPHLDALAKDGIRMTSAFCTTASCSASRSVILTGMYNHANGQYGHEHSYHHFRTLDSIKSLPVRLTEAGYRTARIGKLHVGPEEVYKFSQALPGNARSPVGMAENCRDLIAAKSDKPFFLYFCTADPHRSGGGDAKDGEKERKADPFGNRPSGYPSISEVKYDPKNVIVPPFLPDTKACREELAQYYQSVSRIDQGLGRLVQILKESGHYDDTMLIFTSDHGIAFPGAKTNLYEPGMKVPMVVRGQGAGVRDQKNGDRRQGTVCDAMVCHADLTPTILEFAGVVEKGAKPQAAGQGLQGRSFLPALRNPGAKGYDEVYASHTFHEITMYYPMKVVRTRTHKLIWNIAHPLPFPFASDLWEASTWQDVYQHGPEVTYGKRTVKAYIHRAQFELYDLTTDPDEVKNLATDPAQAKLLEELKGKIKAFQKRTNDPWILKWDYE
ncbi:MAG: sulfatase [Planctomycetales bacterium]|nr:sulfatase [Planctomycetales bacterium]